MADRAVYKTGKNSEGDITSLCGGSTATWSPRSKTLAIADIEAGLHSYYVPWKSGRTEIDVVDGPTGKYLRTLRDGSTGNNLGELPDC